MKIEKYQLISEKNFTNFEFISIGPKGSIRKTVQFQQTTNPVLYNLAFGDKSPVTGSLDDLAISNNSDSEKVLATVVTTLYLFFDAHPFTLVYAEGSTKSRTRLYRIGITKFYDEIVKDFYLYGRMSNEIYEFELNKDYDGFLAQRKFH